MCFPVLTRRTDAAAAFLQVLQAISPRHAPKLIEGNAP
jgi:hypothetical protein